MSSSKIYGPTPGNAVPVSQTVTVATEVAILNPALAPTPGDVNAVNTPTPALFVAIPSGSALEKKAFEVVASGTVTTVAGTSTTAAIGLYVAPSAVIAADTTATLANSTKVGTSGAIAAATAATSPFVVRARDCVYDSTSGKLSGVVETLVNGVFTAPAAFLATVTGISGANDPIMGFLLSVTLTAGGGSILVQSLDINF